MYNNYNIISHGVGSIRRGSEYHHIISHLLDTEERTLCGIIIKNTHWHPSYFFTLSSFKEHWLRVDCEEFRICQKCTNKFQRNK